MSLKGALSQQLSNLKQVAVTRMKGTSDGKFFTNTKRGELHELTEDLQSPQKEKKRAAIKRVIANMTVGKDMSTLFPQIVKCMQTSDVEIKKLVYLYVVNYSQSQPEMAILAVNTFRKDAMDANPLIRALAIRTMGCIRLPQISEYLLDPLQAACEDPDAYVRRTATLCVAKLYDTSASTVKSHNLLGTLRGMLKDPNPSVIANAVASLRDVEQTSNGREQFTLDDGEVAALLAALNDCSEWGQIYVLDGLTAYCPGDEREAEAIVERVSARLCHANAAIVLGAIRNVLHFAQFTNDRSTVQKIQKKLTPPLITLLSSPPEMQFVALRCVTLLLSRDATLLDDVDPRIFFCKYTEPVYVKLEKVEVLVRHARVASAGLILGELKEYASDINVPFVRKSIRAIGRVAIKLGSLEIAETAVQALLQLARTQIPFTVHEVVATLRDVLRRFPNRLEKAVTGLCEDVETLDSPAAKAAMVWIIGEYSDKIPGACGLMEAAFIPTYLNEQTEVQLEILTAVVKMYLREPRNSDAERSAMRVVHLAADEVASPDVRDRGVMYLRLLAKDPQLARKVVLAAKPPIEDCVPESNTLVDGLVAELGSLSSVYGVQADGFVKKQSAQDREVPALKPSKSAKPAKPQVTVASSVPLPNEGFNIKPEMVELHSATTPGSNGITGVSFSGCLGREDNTPTLHLSIANRTHMPLSNWALQMNNNAFGLAPAGSLQVPTLPPGQSHTTRIPLRPNVLVASQPQLVPLLVQTAIKNQADVFYMNVK
ncbi:MAG: uncharacterized protein KVP18_002862 [Porospora cf. gigantea A]|nr:MAG: hypothetical protein KVP18_002862 [Porospora cf. gigantea A]